MLRRSAAAENQKIVHAALANDTVRQSSQLVSEGSGGKNRGTARSADAMFRHSSHCLWALVVSTWNRSGPIFA